MVVRVEPIQAPQLYPSDPLAILDGAYNAIYTKSGGTINDFSPHSVASALLEGQLFSTLELLYYVNKLPDTRGLEFLKVVGIQRILGRAAAAARLVFTLTTPLSTSYTLSAGYVVKTPSGLEFTTDTILVIPPGQSQGVVSGTASAIINGIRQVAIGSQYNTAAFTIKQLTETRAYLQGVINDVAATGGTDAETLDEMRSRGFAALRRRSTLITAEDYEQEAIAALGIGSVAKAVPLLAFDKQSLQDGAVHVFLLNADQSAPNEAQISTIRSALQAKSLAGLKTLVSVSVIELYNLEVFAIAELIPGSDPEAVAIRINAALEAYLAPGKLPLGESILIKEVERIVRNSGVLTVKSVSFLNFTGAEPVSFYGDVPLPDDWTAAHLYSLEISLLDNATGQSYGYSFGFGGDVD